MTTPNPFNLSDAALRVGRQLFDANRSGQTFTLASFLETTGLSPFALRDAMEPLMTAGLIRSGDPLSGEQAVEITPLLPSALEGTLDYLPSDDDRRLLAAVDPDTAEPETATEALAVDIGIPFVRLREALGRLELRRGERGVRMRIVLEASFPDVDPQSEDLVATFVRWKQSIEASNAVRCRRIRLRDMMTVGFSAAGRDYEDWRERRGQYDPSAWPTDGGIGGLPLAE